MPEESLFNEPAPEVVNPESGGGSSANDEGPGNGHSASSGAGLTEASVQAMLAPLQADLQANRQELATANSDRQALQNEIAQLRQGAEPAPPTNDDFLNEFTDDPQAAIEARIQRGVQAELGKLAPFLEQQHNTQHDSIVSNQRRDVDAEFGEGTWDAEIKTVFDGRLADIRKTNPQALSDPAVMKAEMYGVMGLKRTELNERQANFTKTTADAEQAKTQAILSEFRGMTGMTGGQGVAPVSTSKEPTPAEAEYLRSKSLDGGTANVQDLRESASRGSSLTEWREAQKGKAS